MFPKYSVLSKFINNIGRDRLICYEARRWMEDNKHRGTKWLWNNCPNVDWMVYLLFLCKGYPGWISEKTWNKVYTKYVASTYPPDGISTVFFTMLPDSVTPDLIRKMVPSPYPGKKAA